VTRSGRTDAIVVGAGIVGAACARALAREGMRVTVLDAAFAGGGTTAAGMGHIVVMDDSPEQLALTALSVELWRELRPALADEVEFDPCGTIWVAEDAAQMDAVREKELVYREHGIRCEVLAPARLAELEPNLRSGLAGGLFVPGDAVLYRRAPRSGCWTTRAHTARRFAKAAPWTRSPATRFAAATRCSRPM